MALLYTRTVSTLFCLRNCLFRAVSDQLTGYELSHAYYREMTANYMASFPEEFAPYLVDTTIEKLSEIIKHELFFVINLPTKAELIYLFCPTACFTDYTLYCSCGHS